MAWWFARASWSGLAMTVFPRASISSIPCTGSISAAARPLPTGWMTVMMRCSSERSCGSRSNARLRALPSCDPIQAYVTDMRVLISGAAGFIGSHLTDLHLSQGDEVVGMDNFVTGRRENIAHLSGNRKYQLIERDVIEPPVKIDGPVDRIYHLASPASPKAYVAHRVATMKVNSQGSWNLLELA